MSNIDIISMAIKNLFKRKLRTLLTVLGVVIGTASIIIMVSLGMGINRNFTEYLNQSGDLMAVTVRKPYSNDYMYSSRGGGVSVSIGGSSSSGGSQELILDDSAIAQFKKMPGAIVATPVVDLYSIKSISGKYQNWITLRGIDIEAMEPLGLIPAQGEMLNGEDKYQIIFGYNVPFEYYNPNDRYETRDWWWAGSGEPDTRVSKIDIFEDRIQMSYDWNFGSKNAQREENRASVKPYTLKVMGWLPTKGENDYYCYMDVEEVVKIKEAQQKWENSQYQQSGGTGSQKKTKGYEQAIVKFSDIKYVEAAIEEFRVMGYNAYGLVEQLNSMNEMTKSLKLMLGAIGGVSLFVAAIGISNTMIMSIYERTKEIGVMKVIGATIRDIRRLFLLEAALIGFLGGMFGIAISLAISAIINTVGLSFFDMVVYTGGVDMGVSYIPPWLCLASLAFAAAIGLVSGFLPARRATRLSALTAIRTE